MMGIRRVENGRESSLGPDKMTVPADLFLDADRMQKEIHEKVVRGGVGGRVGVGMMGQLLTSTRHQKIPTILPKPDHRKRAFTQLDRISEGGGGNGSSSGSISTITALDGGGLTSGESTIFSPCTDDRTIGSGCNSTFISNRIEGNLLQPPIISIQPQYTGCRYDIAKPPYSYASLIAQALLAAPTKRLTLNQIYSWIMEKYPYYRSENSGWQNSIRHNLSLNSCFVKLAKSDKDSGKGSHWTLNEDELAAFKDGAFKRRKLGTSSIIGRRRRRKDDSVIMELTTSISVEPIAPSICDWDGPGEGQGEGESEGEGEGDTNNNNSNSITTSITEPPLGTTIPSFDWESMTVKIPNQRVNDSTVNGAMTGLYLDDIFRASSPSNQPATLIAQHLNHRMSVDYVCPELAEAGLFYSIWELQSSAAEEVRTDYTDPLEILQKI